MRGWLMGGWILLAGGIALSGCSDSGSTPPPNGGGEDPVTLSGDVQPIFTARCASDYCHGTNTPSADLILAEGQTYAQTVGIPSVQNASLQRVHASQPDSSYLYHRTTGFGDLSIMPPGGRMSDDDNAAIRTWIEQGAQNN